MSGTSAENGVCGCSNDDGREQLGFVATVPADNQTCTGCSGLCSHAADTTAHAPEFTLCRDGLCGHTAGHVALVYVAHTRPQAHQQRQFLLQLHQHSKHKRQLCTWTRTRDFTWRGKVAEAATESVRVNKRVVHRKRWCVQVKHKRAFQVCLVPALSDSFPSNKQAGASEHSNNTRLKRREQEKTGNSADTTLEGLWPKQSMLSPAMKKCGSFTVQKNNA